ncbi:hypothetical protein HMPREF0043_01127 [Actinobaculum sp. oral taxon 183 str. F0552]|nr:hypothetical protein HMPREF0043_01127 [Actinobaculum sp. oral taxon 183 str. F0552]
MTGSGRARRTPSAATFCPRPSQALGAGNISAMGPEFCAFRRRVHRLSDARPQGIRQGPRYPVWIPSTAAARRPTQVSVYRNRRSRITSSIHYQ